MKNKKSLKNLKQFQNKVRFNFYVRFRPVAQKLFFPIVFLIFLVAVAHYEWTRDKSWVFENKVAVVFEESSAEGAAPSKSVGDDRDGTLAQPQTQTLVSSTSTDTSPVRATSEIEAKILKAFDNDPVSVAVAKCESQLDPTRIGDTDFHRPSVGLFQINQYYHPYTTKELQDADRNIEIAKNIKDRWGNWNAWSCYKFGYYQKYLNV